MKRKLIENTAPKKPKNNGSVVTAQLAGEILVLNIYEKKELLARYCMNTETYEHEVLIDGVWKVRSLGDLDDSGYRYGFSPITKKGLDADTPEDEKIVKNSIKDTSKWDTGWKARIRYKENEYNSGRSERREESRRNRINRVMDMVPEKPEDFENWILQVAAGKEDYLFFNKDTGKWGCSSCKRIIPEKTIKRADGGKKLRHNDEVICPICGHHMLAKKRTDRIQKETQAILMQPLDEERSVIRHFDVQITWSFRRKEVRLSESVRIVAFKISSRYFLRKNCDIYHNQHAKTTCMLEGYDVEEFDNRGNWAKRRIKEGYLYPNGIREALEDTVYVDWTPVFSQMAQTGICLDYNNLMIEQGSRELVRMTEYLLKGRFYSLLQECAGNISYHSRQYVGTLKPYGETIEEVFGICDRQKINRIRELDGGENMVLWMRWSEQQGKKIPAESLAWLKENDIAPKHLVFALDHMSPQQIVHYVTRQKKESYPKRTIQGVLYQWEDYLNMCRRLKKDMTDEMVYRPRELKRRHDEAVLELEKRSAELQAEEYASRFPGVEEVMEEIQEKYTYRSERYQMIVPQRCIDIVLEGRALHHCAGSSERYFDRIRSRETYICFLRRAEEPDKPYYTIEVEPGGTIRQHRGYLDEEPGIEEIRPFLREWQQVIKKRMSEKDREYARISAVKRAENIEELKEKKNLRVLKALEEDFMEVI